MESDAVLLFYAGMMAQAIFLLLDRFEPGDILKFLGCCAASLLGLIPGKHERIYNLPLHLFIIACVFSVAYGLCFKEKILEHINKEILMVWTLIGLYIALRTPLVTAHLPVLLLLLALCLIPIINAFAGNEPPYAWKVYFYVWFLCVLVGIAASKFAFSTMAHVFGFRHGAEEINALGTVLVGMSFLYLAVNLWYVVELIPVPGKHQSFTDRLANVKQSMKILAGDYDAEQVRWWKTLVLLVVAGSLLTANHFRQFISDETLVPLLIVALPVVDKFKSQKMEPPSLTPNHQKTGRRE